MGIVRRGVGREITRGGNVRLKNSMSNAKQYYDFMIALLAGVGQTVFNYFEGLWVQTLIRSTMSCMYLLYKSKCKTLNSQRVQITIQCNLWENAFDIQSISGIWYANGRDRYTKW